MPRSHQQSLFKTVSLYFIALGFFIGGIMHFTHTDELAAITPLPLAREIVWVTGVMEFLFVIFLLRASTRQATAIWLCVFCLAVLTANINMAINKLPMFGQVPNPVILWSRIPAQFVLIAWIIYATDALPAIRKNGCYVMVRCKREP